MTPHGAHTLAALRRTARHDTRLSSTATRVFEDICELAEETGFCRKKPAEFCLTYDFSNTTFKRLVAELVAHGYVERVALPWDGRKKGFRPTWPTPANPAVQDDRDQEWGPETGPIPEDGGPNLGSISEMGPNSGPDIGTKNGPAPRVLTPPTGESGARAHTPTREEPPSDAADSDPAHLGAEAARPAWAPTLDAVLARAAMAGIAPDVAERFYWHYEGTGWMTGGAHSKPIANWVGSLMSWKLREPQFARRTPDADRGDAAAATAFLTGATT